MNNRYLIGDVAKYLSLSRDTLRYYDKLGIVSPKKDEGNGYRYYNMDDIITLSYVMILKDVGISLDDIKEMIYNYSLKDMRLGILNQEKVIDKKIEELMNIKTKIRNFNNWCITAENYLNKFEIRECPKFLYTMEQVEIKESKLMDAIEKLRSNSYIKETVFSMLINKDVLFSSEIKDEHFYSGGSGIVEEEYVSDLKVFPSRKCLHTVIEITCDQWDSELVKIKDYIHNEGLIVEDNLLCRAIAFENKDGFPKDFYEIWIPVA